MLMSSLLGSSDTVAAISLISAEKQPNLFSIVFGEGITNDAVSIILFNTVYRYTTIVEGEEPKEIDIYTPLNIARKFVELGFYSILIGILFGLLSAYILAKYRSYSKSPVVESMMIFCFGYLSYVCSEIVEMSGIISLLTSGITMAKYTSIIFQYGKQSSYCLLVLGVCRGSLCFFVFGFDLF